MAEFLQPEKVIRYLHAESGMRIADFGSGNGFFTFPLAEIVGSGGRVIALDIQKESLEYIRRQAKLENLTNIDTIWANLELPHGSQLDDNSCDGVIIANILFQAEDKQALIREAMRVLRPGGRLIILEWDDSDPPPGPPEDLRIPKRTVREYCEGMGMTLVEELDAGNHHYGFLFKK